MASEEVLVLHDRADVDEPDAPVVDDLVSTMVRGCPKAWARRSLRPGEVLWFKDDLADELALVVDGRLDVVRGKGGTISTVSAGQMLGEASVFLEASVRTATVRASAPTDVLVLGRAGLDVVRETQPELYIALLDQALLALAQRVEAAGRRVAAISEGTLPRPRRNDPVPGAGEASTTTAAAAPAVEAVLRALPPLESAGDAAIGDLAAAMLPRHVSAGSALVLEGEVDSSLFVLASGRLSVQRSVGSHTATHLGVLLPVGLLGTGAFVLGRPRNATCVALEDSLAFELSRAAYEGLTGESGRLLREALVHALRGQIVSVTSHLDRLQADRAERLGHDDESVALMGATVMWPPPDSASSAKVHDLATDVLCRLFRHRRLLPGSQPCDEHPCDECLALHRPSVERAIAADRPIRCVLPAFPVKSPSPAKTLGKLPDMAEEQALRYLQKACDSVAEVYPPGLEVTICSDGRVFSDLVLVTDEDVTRYGRAVVAMIEGLSLKSLSSFNLEDLFEVTTFEGMRDHLLIHYAESVGAIRDRVLSDEVHTAFFRGVLRFLVEDRMGLDPSKTKNRLQKECKADAYGMIQRSNAWTRVIAECFPNALRLSIHPQPPHSAKVGILLGEADDAWMTPWHSVALREGDRWRFLKRRAAEKMGARLVERDGRPSHFELVSA
jgi:L-tyrosine isonitrile synthase